MQTMLLSIAIPHNVKPWPMVSCISICEDGTKYLINNCLITVPSADVLSF